jgi:hypothetical protein
MLAQKLVPRAANIDQMQQHWHSHHGAEPLFHKLAKHIDIRWHQIHDLVEEPSMYKALGSRTDCQHPDQNASMPQV